MSSKFWIATRIDDCVSTYKYHTKEDAIAASKKFAQEYPNKQFYVLESCGFSEVSAEFHASEDQRIKDEALRGDKTTAEDYYDTAEDHYDTAEEYEEDAYDQLRRACVIGDLTEVKRVLLEGLVDINKKDKYGWTVLLDACWHGRDEVVKYLISQGADVNVKDTKGKTALNCVESSPFCSSSEIEELLIKAGCKTE